ncbi:NUDIX domain-containing protein [Agromyces sp. NPDC056523]|uniref:NUDIX hydrolase n=1 Tax=Agromyces sp. NPDC056523 TaxID=3345850 RepID=UPI00366DB9FD
MDRDEAPATVPAVGSAATVVLLRDGLGGVEVLLAERPDRGSFAGAWVFPGGAVDDDDAEGEPLDSSGAARRAAVRETAEEVGLAIDPEALVEFAVWSPPEGVPKRLRTRFFASRAPEAEPVPAPAELVATEWLRPADALARHAGGRMTLFPPTWVTLHGLRDALSVEAVLARLAEQGVLPFVGRFSGDRSRLFWQEDEEFAVERENTVRGEEAGESVGARHRLLMDQLPWRYVRSF